MQVRELITKLGFDVDEKALKKFEDRVQGAKTMLGAFVGVVGGAVAATAALTVTTARSSKTIEENSSLVGLGVTEYQRYRMALAAAGVESETFDSSLMSLNRAVGETLRGNQNLAQSFALIGIQLEELRYLGRRELFLRIADGMKNLSPELRGSVSKNILGGGGWRMGNALAVRGRAGIEALADEFNDLVLSEEQIRRAAEFNDEMTKLRLNLNGLRMQIGIMVLPIAEKFVARMKDWIQVNRQLIMDRTARALKFLAGVAEMSWKFFDALLKVLGYVSEKLGGFENAAKLAGFALAAMTGASVLMGLRTLISLIGALNVASWANPYLLIAAAIFAAILALDDFYTYLKGGESLFGTFWKSFVDAYHEHVPAWLRSILGHVGRSVVGGVKDLAGIPAGLVKLANWDMRSNPFLLDTAIPSAAGVGRGALMYSPTTHVTVTTPYGTTQQQADFLDKVVRGIIQDENNKMWSVITAGNPALEQ